MGAMEKGEVRRLLVIPTAFLFSGAWLLHCWTPILSSGMKDAVGIERLVGQSTLDWTIVRPPRLTDDRRVERCRVSDATCPHWELQISRADLAQFTLEQVEKHEHVRGRFRRRECLRDPITKGFLILS
jgi:putative NAD(P)-binding protein